MEYAMKVTTRKYPKAVICFLLCLAVLCLTFLTDYQEAYAFFPLVLAAVPEAVYIVSALLVAAGITFTYNTALDSISELYYKQCAPAIKQGISDMIDAASNGIANVTTDVWNSARSWVQSQFLPGENTYTVNYHSFVRDGITIPYTIGAAAGQGYPLESGQITWDGVTYTWSLTDYIGTNKTLNLYKNGVLDTNAQSIDINTAYPWYVYLDTPPYLAPGLQFRVHAAQFDSSTYYMNDIYWPSLPGSYDYIKNETAPTETQPYIGQACISDPAYDIVTPEGSRTIAYPNSLDDLIGKTSEDVSNPVPATTPGDVVTPSWLQGILDGLGQLLVGTLAQLKAAVEGVAAPIVDAVTGAASAVGAKVQDVVNAIAGVAENTAEADMTDRMKQFKIPDLFILILKVILACIRLMLRALVFIATLPAIPASAGDVDSNFLSGVNFLKDQTIPYFNVSLWSIVTGVIAIFFGLAVVKRVRRIYSV